MKHGLKALVVGYGSIGARHARLLTEMGCQVAIVSRHSADFSPCYANVRAAICGHQPDYIVIASRTDLHHQALLELAELGFAGKVLVEKPLFHQLEDMPANQFSTVAVGYNLRFHPVLTRLRALLRDEQVLSVQCYTGQYLPDWRPGSDYRNSYSAQATLGGGVLNDLSHELDYLSWLFGTWQKVVAVGGQFSNLAINSDDCFSLLMAMERCPVISLQLNYWDRHSRRCLVVNTQQHTYEADLVKNQIVIDRQIESIAVERDDSYRAMHHSILDESAEALCSVAEGMATMSLIHAAKTSAAEMRWVTR